MTSNLLKVIDFFSDGLPIGWREHRTLTITYLPKVRVTNSVHVLTAYDRDDGPETLVEQTTEAVVSGYMVVADDSSTAEVSSGNRSGHTRSHAELPDRLGVGHVVLRNVLPGLPTRLPADHPRASLRRSGPLDVHDVVCADGGGLGNMERLMRIVMAIGVVCLVSLATVSCGDPALSTATDGPSTAIDTNEHVYDFAPIKPVVLADRGPRCATIWIGGVIDYISCVDVDHLPNEVMEDAASGLFVLVIDSGDLLTFSDPRVRVLTSSQHYVVLQLSTEMSPMELSFTVTSGNDVRRCAMRGSGILRCR